MGLPLRTRLRVRARQGLSEGLRVVPAPAMHRLHERFERAGGVQRRLLEPAVSVLRHRPLAPLADFPVPGGSGVRLVAAESRLTRLLYWYGEQGYEGIEAEWWRRLCARAESIVELGANIGYYTVQGALAAPRARYRAVEANPESVAIVRRNLELNELTERVELTAAAVVGAPDGGSIELALPDEERYAAPTGAFLTGAEGISRASTRTVTVPTVAAAEVLAGADLVKLDIEGYEATVLDAARAELAASRPTIVVEVLKKVPRLRAILADLHAEGYLAFAIGTDSLHLLTAAELRSADPLPRYGSRDVILVPAERAGTL